MQLDPSHTSPQPLASGVASALKRSYGQAATALKSEAPSDGQRSPKVPKFESDSRRSASPQRIAFSQYTPMPSSTRSGGRSSRRRGPSHSKGGKDRSIAGSSGSRNILPGPFMDHVCVERTYKGDGASLDHESQNNPKSALSNFMSRKYDELPNYQSQDGVLNGKQIHRATVTVGDGVVGQGDASSKKEAEKVAAFSAILQLMARGEFGKQSEPSASTGSSRPSTISVKLSDGSSIQYERARQFMDYYCRRFGFGKPDLTFQTTNPRKGVTAWDAIMTVGGRRIGLGNGKSKKDAQTSCYLDVTQYLEGCDQQLWVAFTDAAKTGRDLGLAPKVYCQMSETLEDEIQDVCSDIRKSTLYKNRPAIGAGITGSDPVQQPPEAAKYVPPRSYQPVAEEVLAAKSGRLSLRRQNYILDPAHEQMRISRQSLPVYTRASDILSHISDNEVTICMAATGSGKTTQVPQLILDEWIDKGQGAQCNIICTQPRRLAAISVADRVAKERGEIAGRNSSIGYQVRFEAKHPEDHGSVTFCTIGIFLKRMQSALQEGGHRSLDDVTHILVDEVHERDVDTDLLLVTLKRLLADRKARNKPLKVVLMSATLDPSLFQNYFPDEHGNPAKVIEVPGRSFPVEKHFLDEFVSQLASKQDGTRWVFSDEKVIKYLHREIGPDAAAALGIVAPSGRQRASPMPEGKEVEEELEIPYPLVALTISHVIQISDSGHVLVFFPGWDEIQAVQRILQSSSSNLGVDFTNRSKFQLHVLHSSIPLAEQQMVFDAAPPGVRRIILSTNIAETSVTIPDVVYVVDTAKIKENRYDPERHMSALVSAWVGTSNLNQRAGRAGRHRPGEYYGILSSGRAAALHTHQTVEMKRVDLSNVVMHVKALDFPDMEVEDVLAATIEPPEAERVSAAMNALTMVGALDGKKNLTSLGRVLLQLPVDAQMGRLVLFGSFFKCLDGALTLAAILTNRDPFLNPPLMKKEAQAVKDSWTPLEFRSDALAVLRAYNTWWEMQGKGEYVSANRFCSDNFLSKPTLLMISKIKGHLLQSLYHAGVIDVSAGGSAWAPSSREFKVPPELNENRESLPLLAALIAIASQPKFAIRTSAMAYRTAQDKFTTIHPSSVNHRKRENAESETSTVEKQLIAFAEKRQNLSVIGSAPGQMYLVGCTRLDALTYMLFGAYHVETTETGLICDDWLPIAGNLNALDDIQRLKILMESCMLRVFEGINMSRRRNRNRDRRTIPIMARARDAEEDESDDDDSQLPKDLTLSTTEIKELDYLTRDIVRILDKYSEERLAAQSRRNSRPGTPSSPHLGPARQSFGYRSGTSTPYKLGIGTYDSRPSTPSRLVSSSLGF